MVKEYSRTQRQTPYTGSEFDDFSRLMYGYSDKANEGFTFTDIDGILRNYKKQTLCLIEVKTHNGQLTYSQAKVFNEMDAFLKRGVCCGWSYIGFLKLTFENTTFDNGKVWANGKEITKTQYYDWLSKNF